MPEPRRSISYNLAEIKEIPILDVCDYLGLAVEKRGKNYWCRVRQEKHPSVILHTENNTFYDFGNTEHGSNIDLVCYATGKSFSEAVIDLGRYFQLQPESREDIKKRFSVMSFREYSRIGLHGDLATKNFKFPIEHLSPGKLLSIEQRYRMSMNELRKNHPKTYERILREKAIPYVEQLRNSYYFDVWRYHDFLQSFNQSHLFYDSDKTQKRFNLQIEDLKKAEKALYKACAGTSIQAELTSVPNPFRVISWLQREKIKISIGSHSQEQLKNVIPHEIKACSLSHEAFFDNKTQNCISQFPHAALLSMNGVEVYASSEDIQKIQSFERYGINMENSLVIGILNIVEDKLREFGIQIPDEVRDESTTDPIVGYTYAELHDRIMEYLEEQGVNLDELSVSKHPSNDLDSVKNMVSDLLESISEPFDTNSAEYKAALQMTGDLCLREFPDLYYTVFGSLDNDLIFAERDGLYFLYYYNPDSVSGGQIVECYFDDEDAKRIIEGEPYIDVLAENRQYLHDIDTVHFFESVFHLIEAKNEEQYLGSNVYKVCQDITQGCLEKTVPLDNNLTNEQYNHDPLMDFIEQEVTYRFKNILHKDISDDVLNDIIDDLQENTDVLFDYDAIDDFLMERLEMYTSIGEKSPHENVSLQDMIHSTEINLVEQVEALNASTPEGMIVDSDTILVDLLDNCDFEFTGISQDIFNIWKNSTDKKAVEAMFYEFTDMEFHDYLLKCQKEITRQPAEVSKGKESLADKILAAESRRCSTTTDGKTPGVLIER